VFLVPRFQDVGSKKTTEKALFAMAKVSASIDGPEPSRPNTDVDRNGEPEPSQAAQRLKQVASTLAQTAPAPADAAQAQTTTPTTTRPANVLHERYPVSELTLPDHHIDDVRSLKVVVIGAGLSGILAGILLPVKVPKLQLTILEKNDDVVSKADRRIGETEGCASENKY
jgi:hypothetical protein